MNKIQLMKKRIYPENLDTLFELSDFNTDTVNKYFDIKCGKWYTEDGWLVGENRECSAAMAITKEYFTGDLLIEFDAATVAPATRDINVTWHGSWNEEANTREMGYVMGVNGFWEGRIGFEKSPKYDLLVLTELFKFEPGKIYHITVGSFSLSSNSVRVFMAIDGVVALEITDPAPIDTSIYGFVGFEAFCTKVRYKNLKIKRLELTDDYKTYTPEF